MTACRAGSAPPFDLPIDEIHPDFPFSRESLPAVAPDTARAPSGHRREGDQMNQGGAPPRGCPAEVPLISARARCFPGNLRGREATFIDLCQAICKRRHPRC